MTVNFDKNQGLLDKDFQLFYATGDKDVGLTALTHRPIATEDGYFTLLLTPKVEMAKEYEVPRDMVLVLDTSGSMRGVKMEQARKALKYCLDNLGPKDRFALINFATTVNKYRDDLLDATPEQVDRGQEVGGEAGGDRRHGHQRRPGGGPGLPHRRRGPIVHGRLLHRRPADHRRDQPDKILKNIAAKNTANTRIFTFGVGDDVNATFLDSLAEQTRAGGHLRPAGRGHRGQGQRPVQQDQQSGADQPEADADERHHVSTRSIRRSCPTCSTAVSWWSWAATAARGRRRSS